MAALEFTAAHEDNRSSETRYPAMRKFFRRTGRGGRSGSGDATVKRHKGTDRLSVAMAQDLHDCLRKGPMDSWREYLRRRGLRPLGETDRVAIHSQKFGLEPDVAFVGNAATAKNHTLQIAL